MATNLSGHSDSQCSKTIVITSNADRYSLVSSAKRMFINQAFSLYSIVSLEWAGPGVGGGIVFPLSVSVGFALKLLLSDVFIGVSLSILLLNGGSRGGGNEGEDNGSDFHC